LVIVLHGYGASGLVEERYLGLDTLVDGRGVLVAAPDGTIDDAGAAFWNPGIAACCDFFGSPVDDVAYVSALIHEIRAVYTVDPSRIFVVGHSNGGFMAHRLACALSSELAAVVSLAGTMDETPAPCTLEAPVSVLQVHGDRDGTVLYDGGTRILGKSGPYASAPDAVRFWAKEDGCGATTTAGAPVDLETTLPGAETAVTTFDGCPQGTEVALWTIQGGSHIPTVGSRFPGLVWKWLDAHRRP
jgi:polyhydroxybutyrate depolymerase